MAQAILLKDVDSLGSAGDAVDVSPGYLRNFLLPRRLAQPATDASLREAQRRREAAETAAREGGRARRGDRRAAGQDRAHDPAPRRRGRQALRLGYQRGDRGGDRNRPRAEDRPEKIRLDDPIREIGTYMVEVELSGGAVARVKTIVAEAK